MSTAIWISTVVHLSPDLNLRARIVASARGHIGTPYRHQGSRLGVGCDCLGLVLAVWRDVYGRAPEQPLTYASDWAETGTGEPLLDAARRHCVAVPGDRWKPGDLLVFRFSPHVAAKHLGIVAAPDTMIHARERHAVCETPLTNWWLRRIAGAFAFPNGSETV